MNTDDLYSDNLGSQLNQLGSIASDSLDAAMDTDTLEMDGQGADVQDTVDDQEEDDEEFLEDDLSILMRAWVNERNAPDLLEYEGTTIENLMELVDFQTQKIKSQPPMIANIIKVDVDRVKYLVRSYLRTRLAKIEQHAMHYTRDDMYKERMSQNELEYAKGFVSLEEKHMRRSFLDQLPPHLRGLDETAGNGMNMVTKPNLDAAVFCRVRTNVGEFQFDTSEDPILMKRNNIFITRYNIIRNLLEDGKVELI